VFAPRSLERGAMLSVAGLAIALSAILVGISVPQIVRRPWRRLSVVRLPWRRRTRRTDESADATPQ
jgi:hypothetical protein